MATVKLSSSSTALLAIKPRKRNVDKKRVASLQPCMGRLETGVLTVLWNQVLQRFQLCSASLQSADQDLNTTCAIYRSLIVCAQKLRPTYAAVECTAKQLTNCEEYRQNTQRTRKRNQKYDGSGSQPDEAMTAAATFRVSAFTVIIDSLVAALQKRSQDYEGISARFGFLRNVRSMSSEKLSVQHSLVEWFPDDLEASLSGELVQFAALLDTDIGRQATSIASQQDATDRDTWAAIPRSTSM